MSQVDGRVGRADSLDAKAASKILLKRIMSTLEKHYPGWLWVLGVNDLQTGGVLSLRSDRLHPEWGYLEHIERIQGSGAEAWAIKAGGDILERFRQRPGPYRTGCLKDMPRDVRGYGIPDISDQERGKVLRQQRRLLDDAFQAGEARVVTVRDHDTQTDHKFLGVNYGGHD